MCMYKSLINTAVFQNKLRIVHFDFMMTLNGSHKYESFTFVFLHQYKTL